MADKNQESVFSDREMSQQDIAVGKTQPNARARLIIIVLGAFVLLLLVFGVTGLLRNKKPNGTAVIPDAPHVESITGIDSSPHTTALTKEENIIREQQTQQNGSSVLPVLTATTPSNVQDPFKMGTQLAPVVAPQPAIAVPQPAVAAPQQSSPVVNESPDDAKADYTAMSTALSGYIASWKVPPSPAQEFAYNGISVKADTSATGSHGAQENAGNAVATTASGVTPALNQTAAGSAPVRTSAKTASFVRAGTVIPALLLNEINSDNPGPILAQITSGPMAGTRLIGKFKSTGKALILSFTTLSAPGTGTYSVDVVAVDQNYAVGMQTSVNNHYLRKYGFLLAASFLEGYGQAIARVNTTVTTGPFGSTVSQGALTNKQAEQSAMGQVGAALSQDLLTEGKVSPTVKLDCKGGCPIGLLFLSDL